MKNVTVLLNANQSERFNQDVTISVIRENQPDFYQTHWLIAGEAADWVGFMDDNGDFIPVDWC